MRLGRAPPKPLGPRTAQKPHTPILSLTFSNTFLTFFHFCFLYIHFINVHKHSKYRITTQNSRHFITLNNSNREFSQSPHNPEVAGSSPAPATTVIELNFYVRLYFFLFVSDISDNTKKRINIFTLKFLQHFWMNFILIQ